MQVEEVKVSYMDKETKKHVQLGVLELEKAETIEEAVQVYADEGKDNGLEMLLAYAFTAYTIEQQRKFREANRPDKSREQSALAKFKQLSDEQKEALLKQAGIA